MKTMKNIRALYAERDSLLEKLERSMCIKSICPDAFASGACSCTVVGNENHVKDAIFRITRGDGSVAALIPFITLPQLLFDSELQRWAEDIRRCIDEPWAEGRIRTLKASANNLRRTVTVGKQEGEKQ